VKRLHAVDLAIAMAVSGYSFFIMQQARRSDLYDLTSGYALGALTVLAWARWFWHER